MPKNRVQLNTRRDAVMSSINSIPVDKLAPPDRHAKAPVLIDVRTDEDFAAIRA